MKANLSKTNAMTGKTLGSFLAITFGLTWGIAALLIMFPNQIAAIFGEIGLSNPLVILAIYAPGFAGLFLVMWHHGLTGLGRFFKRLTLWRAPMNWWLFLILGVPAVVYTAATIKGTINDPFPYSPWFAILPVLAHYMFLGPIEEFGWRGLALPLLQRKLTPFWAGLVLGLIWAAWHVPSFLISGMPQTGWVAAPYFLGIVAMSIMMTQFFNVSRGSLLLAYLFHFQMMNPIFPDVQPYDNLIWIAVAIVLVLVNRRAMFSRAAGATNVLAEAALREEADSAYSVA